MNADASALLHEAVQLHRAGDVAAAAARYRGILATDADHPDALHLLGVTETQRGQAAAGLELIDRSLALRPDQPVALANRGNALVALRRPAEALVSYEQSLQALPEYHLAHFGRGNALAALGRHAEALASHERALAIAPGLVPALVARGGALMRLRRFAAALDSYEHALRLIPGLAPALAGRGLALLGRGELDAATRCIDEALRLSPGCLEALLAHADLLAETGATAAAIAAYDAALAQRDDMAEAWFRCGLALALRGQDAAAAQSLARALELEPTLAYAAGSRLHALLQVCDWQDQPRLAASLCDAVARGEPADFPFSFLAVCDSLALQRRCAATFAATQGEAAGPLILPRRPRASERIRIGYISADFLEHPTAYLTAGLFERHDRERFEVVGISLRDDPASPLRNRICRAMERFVVTGVQSDAGLADMIRDLDLDIAVDLMGYTGEHRAGAVTRRVAPLQVNYLGFPGTMACGAIDYLIGDRFLIPPGANHGYSEQIVYLPDCFQVNDADRPAGERTPTRADCGLPDGAFVFCSFHSSYKLNPLLFDLWMGLLRAHPDSVLWIKGGRPEVERHLAAEAGRRGIDPQRLVFARSLPYPAHLARLALADLCLDTFPFNGGATTSDALWSGVPVVTCAGESFAARMSGSLLHALGIPGLVTATLAEYGELAGALCRDRSRLARLRAAITAGRKTSPLFDTDRFRRHLESAYAMMVARDRAGEVPVHLVVPPA